MSETKMRVGEALTPLQQKLGAAASTTKTELGRVAGACMSSSLFVTLKCSIASEIRAAFAGLLSCLYM